MHQPGLEHASTGMPDQRTTCAATHGTNADEITSFNLTTNLKIGQLRDPNINLQYITTLFHIL